MDRLRELWLYIYTRLYGVARKSELERDMDEELRFHIEMRTRENIERGLAPVPARREAERRFGHLEIIKEHCRDVKGGGLMETIIRDLRYGLRHMLKSPGFTIIAVLSLAIGIGANTAIFSLVNTVMLRPLPVAEPDELISVYPVAKDDSVQAFSYPLYVDFRDRNEVFSGFYATRFVPVSLSHDGRNERVWGYMVTGNYFDVLGVKAEVGRTFAPEEDKHPLTHPVVVLSHGYWQRRFGADAAIIGKTIIINGHNFTVIGVAPAGFIGTEIAYNAELWVPMMMQEWIEPGNPWLTSRGTQNIFASGRLKPGVGVAQATAALNVLAAQVGKEFPDYSQGLSMRLMPPGLIHPILGDPMIAFTWALMAVVALVLLIACTNLANLLLARAAERRKEIAIRLSIGASRGRVVGQLLVESLLLSFTGGLLGMLLALVATRLISSFKLPIDLPLAIDLVVDWRVFCFSMLVSLLTGVIFGLVPALQATKLDLVPALKDVPGEGGAGRSRLRGVLVAAQMALSLVLLVASGLVLRGMQQLQAVGPGFNTDNRLMLSVDLGLQGYDKLRRQQFYRQLLERVRALPGIESASLTNFMPLSLSYNSTNVYIEGQPPVRGAEVPTVMDASVDSGYFATLGIALVAGREFTEQDRGDIRKVAIVNETFVRRFFPGISDLTAAIGKRVSQEGVGGPFMEIVGVAQDGKYFSIGEEARPFIYFPMRYSETFAVLIAHTAANPETAIGAIRNEVERLDATLPIFDVNTMERHMGLSLLPVHISALLLGSFGFVALLLAAIGVYGVMSRTVAQRHREIGIRMALGARPWNVVTLVIKQAMAMAIIGLVVGLAASLLLSRLMASVLYGLEATDVITYATVSLLLMLVVLIACYLPARRATKVDPMMTLRCQ